MVKNIPPSDMPQVRAKVAALTTLSGERKDWGVGRAWERDYLANVSQRCPDEMDTHTVSFHNSSSGLKMTGSSSSSAHSEPADRAALLEQQISCCGE